MDAVGDPVLSARGLRKAFGRLAAVDDVSFDLAQHEILGIAGPNGAGKTMLFNLLTCLPFAPDAGSVSLAGRSLARQSPRAIARAGLVRTFQAEAAFDSLSVRDNVRVAAVYGAGKRGRAASAATDRVLDDFGLREIEAEAAADVPLLAKKRLMIATAVVTEPRVVLLDEPAAGLNPDEQLALTDDIRRIHATGPAIVVIEHVLPFLTRLVHRLLVLASGRVLVEGEPSAVLSDPRVVEAYVGTRAAA